MLHAGLCSVSLANQFDASDVITQAARAGLESIEWADKPRHVPTGDLAQAMKIKRMTLDAGLSVAGYGSYYRLGAAEGGHAPFQSVLETAVALEAPVVRVWAGNLSSDEADESHWRRVLEDGHRVADLAAAADIVVATEYHGGTLTDRNEAALRLMEEADHKNLKTYWQPPQCTSHAYRLEGLRNMLPWLVNVHVFNWVGDFWPHHRHTPLEEGRAVWLDYLQEAESDQEERHALLEFLPEKNNPATLPGEAATLNELIEQITAAASTK